MIGLCIYGDSAHGGGSYCPANAAPIHIKPRGNIGALCDPPWRKRTIVPHVTSGDIHGATCAHRIAIWRHVKSIVS